MKIFVFDTETTGFFDKKNPDLDKQPYIIQFAGIEGNFDNGKFSETRRINQLVKPKINIPYNSSQVHHIYDLDVKDAPKIEDTIESFLGYINESDIIIGHNTEYDEEMIKIELRRLGMEYKYNPQEIICTMKQTVDFCKIIGNGERYKYPKLGELYKKLFGEYFIGAHDAMVDVEATLKCFIELVKKGIISPIGDNKSNVMTLF